MFDLTPGERRAALLLLALLALGTLSDLAHLRPQSAPEPPEAPVAAGAGTGDAAAPPPAPAAPAPAHRGAKSPPLRGLDLTRADAAALDALPGIGPVLAQRIVARRAELGGFHSVEDLRSVPGIGAKLLERIRPYVRIGADVQSATPAAP